jgi:transcriptional regulator with XRE-family HTH domain
MNVKVAERLADIRRKHGLSQEQLAYRLGISRQAVSKWERAESSPDTDNLIALAKLYDLSLDELLKVPSSIADDVEFEQHERGRANAAAPSEAADDRSAQQTAAGAGAAAYAGGAPQGGVAGVAGAAGAAGVAGAVGATGVPGQEAPQTVYVTMDKHAKKAYYKTPDGRLVRKRSGLWYFPFPLLVTIAYLLLGFFFDLWHPGWLLFLTIPLWYWICKVVDNDYYRQNMQAPAQTMGEAGHHE